MTNICVRTFCLWIISYEFFHASFFYTNFCPDELLSLRIFCTPAVSHTSIYILTLAYVLLRTYVLFSDELYPLRKFAYEQLRTSFMDTYYFHTYFGPRIVIFIDCPASAVQRLTIALAKLMPLSRLSPLWIQFWTRRTAVHKGLF